MVDIEKVIKGLAHCTRPLEMGRGGNFCMDCPYTEPIGFYKFKCNSQQMKKDALELLKEHKKKQTSVEKEMEGGGNSWWYVCPECHSAIDIKDTYCRYCGQRVCG